jgi:glycosyltransferase involved in cell wall biosynthesis
MRVLHVSHQYHPAIGGSERYIIDLSETLAQRGHAVSVFTTQSRDYHTWRNELPASEIIQGVPVTRFPSLPRGALAWRLLQIGQQGSAYSASHLYTPHLLYGNGPISPALFAALLRQARDYDLMHINQLHYAHAWTAYIAARWRGVPIVLTPHLHVEQPQTYDAPHLWQVLRGSDANLAVTRAEQDFLAERLPGHQVVLGGNGLRLADFPPRDRASARARFGLPPDAFVLLCLGRKTEYKGLAEVLRIFALLRRQRPDLYLLAVGPETDHSQRLWQQYQGLAGVVVRGAVADDERLDALAACDALAMPSTGEAFGIVYLEAWAYAKPVIGATIQSVASLVTDGVDGLLVDPAMPNQLLTAIMTLVDNPARAAAMGQAGQAKLVRRYTTERITDIVEGLYARVLRRRRTTQVRPARVAAAPLRQKA